MRVLTTVTGTPSHAHASLAVVQALLDAGHEVLVASSALAAGGYAGVEVDLAPTLPDQSPFWTDALAAAHRTEEFVDPDESLMIDVLAGRPLLEATLDALRPLADAFAPDLLLRDGMEFAACLLSEERGTALVTTPSGATNQLDPVRMVDPLNARRVELGLPERADPFAPLGHSRLDWLPARYSMAQYPLPDAVSYRGATSARHGAALPRWAAELDPAKPLVYCAIGIALPTDLLEHPEADHMTLAADPYAALDVMIAAMSRLDCETVVATGGLAVHPTDLPDHVHVVGRAPQELWLECAQLFVTHGGFNSIVESVRAGVPMVLTPLCGDQLPNADRVAALGLGRQLRTPTADDLAATCRAVLDDPATTARVRAAQRATAALPPVEDVVSFLQTVAGTGRR